MSAEPPPPPAPGRRRFERDQDLEFDRALYFSDAVFAIAMTLLVVGIGVPTAEQGGVDAVLDDLRPQVQSFVIGWVVIGAYWLAHHRVCARLNAVDGRFLVVNLAYLAAIAFVPFPTAFVGEYDDPAAAIIYAVTLAAASLFETLMLLVASMDDLLREPMDRPQLRFSLVAGLIPVAVFLISIPIALAFGQGAALLSWLSILVFERLADRLRPPAVPV